MKEPKKVLPELRRKVGNLMMRQQTLGCRQNQKVNSRNSCDKKRKNRKFRSIFLDLRLKREKNAKKGQLVSQSSNIMTGSVFLPMMTLN